MWKATYVAEIETRPVQVCVRQTHDGEELRGGVGESATGRSVVGSGRVLVYLFSNSGLIDAKHELFVKPYHNMIILNMTC